MCASNPTNFSTFFEKYKEYLDDTCKLAVPKKTVRNIINNPWITDSIISAIDKKDYFYSNWKSTCTKRIQMVIEAYTKFLVITVESSNISYQMRKVNTITKNLLLYARYLCSRDALGLKAGRPSAARDDRVSCIQNLLMLQGIPRKHGY